MASELRSTISGVIEGFYGRPWNARQRHQLFGWMRAGGLNTYLYAPKDDRKHRSRWRELYDEAQASELAALMRDCARHGIRFVYAIAPGLDIRFSSASDTAALENKTRQMIGVGCRSLALLFDDIPASLHPEDAALFESQAAAQASSANALKAALGPALEPDGLWFCPTEYCGRMAGKEPARSTYLRALGERLDPAIPVFWTGSEIISREITAVEIDEVARVLRRKPLIWDNLFANDYDARRLHLGPFAGREAALKERTAGVLINPNCEFESNFVAVRSFAQWFAGPERFDASASFDEAVLAWSASFATGPEATLGVDDVRWIAECFYLPYEPGPRGRALLEAVERMLDGGTQPSPGAELVLDEALRRIAAIQERLGELENRELLHALYRPMWDLKESLMLLRQYFDWRRAGGGDRFEPRDHAAALVRGGLLPALQSALQRSPDGSIAPTSARFFSRSKSL